MFKVRVLAVLLAISLSPKAAFAEIDLGTWQTHAAMAEQGAVCGAFADLMTMQSLVDEKVGRLWTERRAYSGSVIRRAAELEGRDGIDDTAIDELLNRYSMWLLNNLANPANAEILDPAARDAASDMIGDVCAGLYAQADRAILKRHPSLAACSPGQAPLPKLSPTAQDKPATCEGDSAILAATTIKQAEDTVADMLHRLDRAQAREDDLANEIAILKIDNDRLLREIDTNRIVGTKMNDLKTQSDQLHGEINTLQQNLATRIAASNKLDDELRDLKSRHEATLARVDTLTTALATARAAVIAAPTRDDMAEKIAELAATRETLRDITDERDSLSSELAMATATLENMTGTLPAPQDNSPAPPSDANAPPALALLETDINSTPTMAATKVNTPPLAQPQAAAPVHSGETPEKGFVVQLGAFSSRTGALSEISRIQTSFPERSALAALTITPLQRNDGSSIFRITTNKMPAEDAQRLCGELWDSMVSCMLRGAP